MSRLSAATLERLRARGWSEDTEAPIEWFVDLMEKEGVPLNEPAREFVRRFGSIIVPHPHHTVPEVVDWFEINPVAAAGAISLDWVPLWSRYVGEELSIVGWASKGYLTLLMGPSGRVWAALDDLVLEVAPTGEEAIEVMATGQKLKQLGYVELPDESTSDPVDPDAA